MINYAVMTYSSFGPIQDVHEKLQFGRVISQLHHIRLETENTTIITFSCVSTADEVEKISTHSALTVTVFCNIHD